MEREAEQTSELDSDSQLLGSYDLKSAIDDIDLKEIMLQDKLDKSEMIIRRVEELTKDPQTILQHFEKILGLKLPPESAQEYMIIEELLYSYENLESADQDALDRQAHDNSGTSANEEGLVLPQCPTAILQSQYQDSKMRLEKSQLVLAYLDFGGEELEYLRIHNFFNKAKIIRNSGSRCFCPATCRHSALSRVTVCFLFTL